MAIGAAPAWVAVMTITSVAASPEKVRLRSVGEPRLRKMSVTWVDCSPAC